MKNAFHTETGLNSYQLADEIIRTSPLEATEQVSFLYGEFYHPASAGLIRRRELEEEWVLYAQRLVSQIGLERARAALSQLLVRRWSGRQASDLAYGCLALGPH